MRCVAKSKYTVLGSPVLICSCVTRNSYGHIKEIKPSNSSFCLSAMIIAGVSVRRWYNLFPNACGVCGDGPKLSWPWAVMSWFLVPECIFQMWLWYSRRCFVCVRLESNLLLVECIWHLELKRYSLLITVQSSTGINEYTSCFQLPKLI